MPVEQYAGISAVIGSSQRFAVIQLAYGLGIYFKSHVIRVDDIEAVRHLQLHPTHAGNIYFHPRVSVFRSELRPLVARYRRRIAAHVARGNAQSTQYERRRRRVMAAYPPPVGQEVQHEILAVRHVRIVEVVSPEIQKIIRHKVYRGDIVVAVHTAGNGVIVQRLTYGRRHVEICRIYVFRILELGFRKRRRHGVIVVTAAVVQIHEIVIVIRERICASHIVVVSADYLIVVALSFRSVRRIIRQPISAVHGDDVQRVFTRPASVFQRFGCVIHGIYSARR